ncbi:hypothetical protein MVEN_00297100 [Mycena venus]|uniref:Ricin B lectin domain-containing protein n=1 Tax=Mycena venus TaxID=2733690 RepID=A0A8H6Z3H3_9AGAR|nr:hypothetical protein MVEN_00297100 [Mycena venus]
MFFKVLSISLCSFAISVGAQSGIAEGTYKIFSGDNGVLKAGNSAGSNIRVSYDTNADDSIRWQLISVGSDYTIKSVGLQAVVDPEGDKLYTQANSEATFSITPTENDGRFFQIKVPDADQLWSITPNEEALPTDVLLKSADGSPYQMWEFLKA